MNALKPAVSANAATNAAETAANPKQIRNARIKLVLLFLLFASPVVASYLTYYVIQPQGRTNYGELIVPQRPIVQLRFAPPASQVPQVHQSQQSHHSHQSHQSHQSPHAAGRSGELDAPSFKGKWLMVTALTRADLVSLERRLYLMRQVRLTTGKDMDRIERALVLLDDSVPATTVIEQHAGLNLVRLPVTDWRDTFRSGSDRIYLVDPLGNLMLVFPFDPDPSKMKKDIAKLLRASRIG